MSDTEGAVHINYTHSGALLKYEIRISPGLDQIAISADPINPFSGLSIFEFYINANTVQALALENPLNRRNPTCLGFWNGDSDDFEDCRMTLSMRDDGDLIVWPRAFHFDSFPNAHSQGSGRDS